jgi:GNAT superfamily N-acetyltransferase
MIEKRSTALGIVRRTLAADCACEEASFARDGVVVTEAREVAGRRRFPVRAQEFKMVTMGRGVVITCNADRMAWASEHLSRRNSDNLFSIATLALIAAFVDRDRQYLAGPDLKFLCAGDTFRSAPAPAPISIELVTRVRIADAYAYPGFQHALGYQLDSARPDMLAALAWHDGRVVGMAGASADSDQLWQIGIDVRPEVQNRGIGKALVSRVTEAILAEGKLPYYSTWASNIRSSNVALGLGYWLAWTEVYARERA